MGISPLWAGVAVGGSPTGIKPELDELEELAAGAGLAEDWLELEELASAGTTTAAGSGVGVLTFTGVGTGVG